MSKLNNIDDAIRNSFENFEVPFDASLWDTLESKMDNASPNDLTSFDKNIKESVNGHEAAYNPAAWTAVESQLTAATSYSKWFLAAGLIGLISLGLYFMTDSDKETVSDEQVSPKEKLVENNVEANSTVENTEGNNSTYTENKVVVDKLNVENIEGDKTVNNDPEKKTDLTKEDIHPENLVPDKKDTPESQPELTVKKWNITSPVISGKTEMCEGEEMKLSAGLVPEKVNVQWLLNGVAVSAQNEITLKNLNAGTYDLELVYSAKEAFKSSCLNPELKKSTQIVVNDNVSVDFKFAQEGDAFYPETRFTVMSTEKDVKYTWILDNESFVGEELVHLFNNKGNYPVRLLAENANGCKIEEVKNIEINTDYNLLAPIAFTPNFDGLNDVFIPEALKYLNLPFTMNIYDRQQGIVFQTTRSDIPWDGKNMNTGEFGSQGAYLWVVELTNKKGEIEQYSGTITILK